MATTRERTGASTYRERIRAKVLGSIVSWTNVISGTGVQPLEETLPVAAASDCNFASCFYLFDEPSQIVIVPTADTDESDHSSTSSPDIGSRASHARSSSASLPSFEHQAFSDVLVLDKSSLSIRTEDFHAVSFTKRAKIIYGIIGILNLGTESVLISVKSRSCVGQILGEKVYEVTRVLVSHLSSSTSSSSSSASSSAAKDCSSADHSGSQVAFIKELFNNGGFYFSYKSDLTNTMYRKAQQKPVDDRFVWGSHLTSLFSGRLSSWPLSLIRGYIGVHQFTHNDNILTLAVISRRSTYRAGTRYHMRGVDEEGHVANYVETEQLLMYCGLVSSYVIVRGSVPLFWEQKGRKYRPIPRLIENEQQNREAFFRHFTGELSLYESEHIVDLLGQEGIEQKLHEAYENAYKALKEPKLSFTAFDFHQECKNNHYEKISILSDKLKDTISSQKYSLFDTRDNLTAAACSSLKPLAYQSGVFRVNCLDCLDRTNVIQTSIARIVFEDQLYLFDIKIEQISELNRLYKEAWANNGDAISYQYAGTSALKGDFTRTSFTLFLLELVRGACCSSAFLSLLALTRCRDHMRQRAISSILGLKETQLDESESIQSLERCVERVLEHSEKSEHFVNAWVMVRVTSNKKYQQRILLLTDKAVYRCKLNEEGKFEHYKRLSLSGLRQVQKVVYLRNAKEKRTHRALTNLNDICDLGEVKPLRHEHGVKLLFSDSSKDQLFLVIPLEESSETEEEEAEKELVDEICTALQSTYVQYASTLSSPSSSPPTLTIEQATLTG